MAVKLHGVKFVRYAESADTLSDGAKFAAIPIPDVPVRGKSGLQTYGRFGSTKTERYKSFSISDLRM